MAFNLDKNKIVTQNNEVTSIPSVSVAPEPSVSPKPNVEFEGKYYKPNDSKSFSPTEVQLDAAAVARQKSARAHEKEVEDTKANKLKASALEKNAEQITEAFSKGDYSVVDKYKDSKSDTSSLEIKKSHNASGYAEILAQNDKTIYEKTSEIFDKYIQNHPDEYPQYAKMSASQKKSLRDTEMGKWFRKLEGKQNITQSERKNQTKNLAILLTTIEAKNLSLKDFGNNVQQAKDLIINGEKQLYYYMLEAIDVSKPEALRELVEINLTLNDPDYLLMTGAEKKKYLKENRDKLLNITGVRNIDKLPESAKINSAVMMKGLLSGLLEKGITAKDLSEMPAKEQSKIFTKAIKDYTSKHPDVIAKLPVQTKLSFDVNIARSNLMEEINKSNPTERDLFNKLEQKAQNGNLSDIEKQMYESYKVLDAYSKREGKDFLNKTADLKSNTMKILVTGLDYENQFKVLLDGVNDPKELKSIINDIVQGIDSDFDKPIQLEALRKVCMQKGMKPAEIIKLLPADLVQKITVATISHPDSEQAARGTDIIASFDSFIMDKAANTSNEILSEVKSVQWLQNYGVNVATTKYDESFTRGINKHLDTNTANELFTYIANNALTDAKKSSIVEQSLLTTNDSERISAYTDSYKTIKSPAVTEGMAAAAHNTTNPNNRAIINAGVDYAIEYNGYSSNEIKNINTARETGQTSYVSNSVSSDSTVSNANSTSETNSQAQSYTQTLSENTSTYANSASGQSGSTQQRVNESFENSNTVAQMKAQLAQASYQHTLAERENTLNSLQAIIDKIQNDKNVRAQKQADLAAKEAKTDEEIKQIVKDAEVKSTNEQEKAQKEIAKEFVEELDKDEKLEKKYNISIDTIQELRNAQRQGDLSKIYSKLGSISADAQKHFIQILSRKDTATIIGFIRNRSTDKSLIKELCKLNPSLIKALDPYMLLDCGIAKADIIKYADSHQLSTLFYELAKVGNTEALNQFYEVLGDNSGNPALQSGPVPGDDRYFEMLNNNMSIASSKVPMRQDINKKVPRNLWG